MNFRGRTRHLSTTDPEEWPALVKEAPPIYAKGEYRSTTSGNNYVAKGGVRIPVGVQKDQQSGVTPGPSRVTLTEAEKEWLGASVRRSDGTVGQVWALAPERGYVWVVADGAATAVHTDLLVIESQPS